MLSGVMFQVYDGQQLHDFFPPTMKLTKLLIPLSPSVWKKNYICIEYVKVKCKLHKIL